MTNCNIIRDLMTLYTDDLCSGESRELVEEHLLLCPQCRGVLESFRSPAAVEPVDEGAAFRSFNGKLRKRNLKKIVLSTVTAVLAIALLAVLAWVPEFPIPWQEGLAEARIPVDGGVDVHINARNYKNAYAVMDYGDDGTYDVYITAVNNVVTMVVPSMDESVDFVRLGNNLCVSYKNRGDSLLFAIPGDDMKLRNIYYVSLSEQELYAAAAEENLPGTDAVLLWSGG